eukprot:gnl/MRDRNA2_/MRDRNA2_58188_c0_seq1.p1 gnl/MRDRNA2_/MRDRNA2_58188_c0~~gnl/MRDRNA2_/MRDRNA2_58188_c0_seq1.p1  ORF type:complete len:526 (-),score=137.12 gnl/MRDRNA2_/MRDRNA2_58188_c0_seq1:193-1770(-)
MMRRVFKNCGQQGAKRLVSPAMPCHWVSPGALGASMNFARLPSRHCSGGAATKSAEPEIIEVIVEEKPEKQSVKDLTPVEMVEYLDRFIIGQKEAKKAVANALRNRWRRQKLPKDLADDINPKNILMVGPTGCGKTEIARRLAKLVDSPFIKVEATKYTEVGFHGRDVDKILEDLFEASLRRQRGKLEDEHRAAALAGVETKIIEALLGKMVTEADQQTWLKNLREGWLEERMVTVDLPVGNTQQNSFGQNGNMPNAMSPSDLQDFLSNLSDKSGKQIKLVSGTSGKQSQRTEKKKVPISEARKRLVQAELDKMISQELVLEKALESVEQEGIVFIDEIDKIVSAKGMRYGPDASAEGVQRDLLPIIEGSTISTKYGNVKTDYILFICSGAFHSVKPADMLAELQGRLPVRVDLKALTEEDLVRILTEPEFNLIKQNTELFKTEGVDLVFTETSTRELAKVSAEINRHIENIGARRLHTVVEKVLEELSFDAAEMAGETVEITNEKVRSSVGDMLKKVDLYRHVL